VDLRFGSNAAPVLPRSSAVSSRNLPARAKFGVRPPAHDVIGKRPDMPDPPQRARPAASRSLAPLFDSRRVMLCVGCGGVGKTTISAALGLAAAKRGKRVLCLTIDPAKRLANSLGLSGFSAVEQTIERDRFEAAGIDVPGSLTLMMLDTKSTFDELVIKHASSVEARDRILNNRLYGYLSRGLAGMQSYMAMEKLLSVKSDPRYDLVILDTPPTSNALDFLDAPERMIQALDSRTIRWFTQAFHHSGRIGLNVLARSVVVVMRGISRLTGAGFLEQIGELIVDLNDLFGGFRQRATRVAQAFRAPDFAYVLVTTPAPVAVREARFLAERLSQQGMRQDALVINRVHRSAPVEADVAAIERALGRNGVALGPDGAQRIRTALDQELTRALLDRRNLSALPDDGVVTRFEIPALDQDVHDLDALELVAETLCPSTTP
jgi:anion-transporting  ArsA/GET3 family ATPase